MLSQLILLLTALPSKLIVIAVCAFLFWLGGFSWKPARRFIMPCILSVNLFFLTHCTYALSSLAAIGSFCLGYGDKSPLRHIFGDGWGRGVWGLLSALCLSIGLFLTGHIFWYFWLPYLVLNFTLENALKNIPQVIGDPIIGAGLACIVLLIK